MPTKTKDLKHRLIHKFRFTEDENRSDDHIWFKMQLPNMPVISTKVSHGVQEIGVVLEKNWVCTYPKPPAAYMR